MPTDQQQTTDFGPFWRLRYRLSTMLLAAGLRLMPECRYRRELAEAIDEVNFRVLANYELSHAR